MPKIFDKSKMLAIIPALTAVASPPVIIINKTIVKKENIIDKFLETMSSKILIIFSAIIVMLYPDKATI